jgi:hypothetical protein
MVRHGVPIARGNIDRDTPTPWVRLLPESAFRETLKKVRERLWRV